MIHIEVNTELMTPYQIGLERGKRIRELRPVIDRVLEELVPSQSESERKEAVQKALRLSSFTKQELPEMYAEIEGVVAGAEWNLEEYALYHNCLYLSKEEIQCCTNIFISETRTEANEPILAKNTDLRGVFEDCQEITSVYSQKGLSFVCLRNAGWLGCGQGINEAGFGFALSSAHTGKYSPGIQSYVVGTYILANARNVSEALEMLISISGVGEICYLMSDSEGDAAAFESGYGNRYDIRKPEDGILISTNHYQSNSMKELTKHLASSRTRWERMNELFSRKGKFGISYITDSMMDHSHPEDFHCICRHEGRMKTIASSLILPRKKIIHVQEGNPCERRGFHSYGF